MIHIVLTCAFLSASLPPNDTPAQKPPGLILVEGGRVIVGSDPKDVEDLIRRMPDKAASFAAETPKHKVEVEDFYLMPTEVTNEQYAAYVRATGAKPPYYWGEEAMKAGLAAFLDEQERLKREAAEQGVRFQRSKFDKQSWWEENWEDAAWEVPEKNLLTPVVLVSYSDVEAYCTWAGLRPMTEFEYARAVRGDGEDLYPWGPEFDRSAVATRYSGQDKPWPVGSFAKGARNGIFDLAGNVWEWTGSPFLTFPKYKPFRVKPEGKGRDITAQASPEPHWRVAVGGSFVSTEVQCRVTTRMGTAQYQTAEALGFRCAASATPGVDVAHDLMRRDIRLNLMPPEQEVNFYVDAPVILQRWKTEESTCEIPGYAVISGYDRVLFVPALKIKELTAKNLRDDSAKEGPIVLGFLSTSEPFLEPALEAGTYYVAFRGAGRLPRKPEEDQEEISTSEGLGDFTQLPGFDAEEDLLLFYDLSGTPVASMPAGTIREASLRERPSLTVSAFVPPEIEEGVDVEDLPPVVPMDDLNLKVGILGKRRGKGFWFDITFKVAPNTILNW